MLLALGPLLLDTAARTVVVGVLDGAGPGAAVGADAVWLRRPTADQVASVSRDTGLPVGVTVDDVTALDELVAAGAVAIECVSLATVDVALGRQLTMWCSPVQADRAIGAGVPVERIVCEPAEAGAPTVVGATIAGDGPCAWGEVLRVADAGARVVRTTDVRSVRRVVTVIDRLASARSATGRVSTS